MNKALSIKRFLSENAYIEFIRKMDRALTETFIKREISQ